MFNSQNTPNSPIPQSLLPVVTNQFVSTFPAQATVPNAFLAYFPGQVDRVLRDGDVVTLTGYFGKLHFNCEVNGIKGWVVARGVKVEAA